MNLQPLGDQAVMAYCDSEDDALRLADAARAQRWPWQVDVVQAYRSVAVFYDALRLGFDEAARELAAVNATGRPRPAPRLHVIPCCYGLGLDLDRVARHTGLTTEEVIALHSAAVYTVYAIGFCPGFPYLGYLGDKLSGVPRLETPRLKVQAGSVGLTGRQTGIYTEERPGGWNILGVTPLELVNVSAGYFPLGAGDRVRFQPINSEEFASRRGQRLEQAE